MKWIAGVVALLLMATGAQAQTDTLHYTITRNGEPIGTHAIQISRDGANTSVSTETDLSVKVMFLTAYHFAQTENEHWVNGRLVGLTSSTDSNGTRHSVEVTANAAGLDIKADGKTSRANPNVVPASFWNPELLQRPALLDTQGGKVAPVAVTDGGLEDLTLNDQLVHTHHYAIKSLFSQDLWYDDTGRLVQSKIIGSDGSIILYRPSTSCDNSAC
jgi:hypothetical protein